MLLMISERPTSFDYFTISGGGYIILKLQIGVVQILKNLLNTSYIRSSLETSRTSSRVAGSASGSVFNAASHLEKACGESLLPRSAAPSRVAAKSWHASLTVCLYLKSSTIWSPTTEVSHVQCRLILQSPHAEQQQSLK